MSVKARPILELFDDPNHAKDYAKGPASFVPGFEALHQMAAVLIREYSAPSPSVFVHGAGGGLEIEAFARENPNWSFLGVDPALPMLNAAKARLSDFGDRIDYHHGVAEDSPHGPFDAATSFLTLHFLDADARRSAVSAIVERLKPGAPFITVHCSFPQSLDARELWLTRHREFVIASGVAPELAEAARKANSENLELYDPEMDAEILQDAGLSEVTPFYSAFTWRGWFGRA
ncbi:MAG: class I SAM-dependent methyltransferase [Pseudomonadota bacterium]